MGKGFLGFKTSHCKIKMRTTYTDEDKEKLQKIFGSTRISQQKKNIALELYKHTCLELRQLAKFLKVKNYHRKKLKADLVALLSNPTKYKVRTVEESFEEVRKVVEKWKTDNKTQQPCKVQPRYGITSTDCPPGFRNKQGCCTYEGLRWIDNASSVKLVEELSLMGTKKQQKAITDMIGKTMIRTTEMLAVYVSDQLNTNGIDQEKCTSEIFIEQYDQKQAAEVQANLSTWAASLLKSFKKGYNITKQLLLYLIEIIKKTFGHVIQQICKWSGLVFNVTNMIATYFVFDPKRTRVMLWVLRRQKKYICREIGQWLADNNLLTSILPSKDTSSSSSTNWTQLLPTWQGATASILKSENWSKVGSRLSASAGKLTGKALEGVPFVGPLVGELTTMFLDEVMDTTTQAMRMELEAQAFLEENKNNFKHLIEFLDPADCVRSMPSFTYLQQKERG
jgi:hypothetical protein